MDKKILCIKNAQIYDAVNPIPYKGDLLIQNGKIVSIAPEIAAEPGMEVYDAAGYRVYPGFVDAHSHIGLDGYGIGYEGSDYNEINDICSPQLRAIDGIQPWDPMLQEAARAGVTTIATGPGSANVLGGTFAAIKTPKKVRVEQMVIRPEVAMKCAFGENPKRCYQKTSDSTRMSTAAILRETLFRAKDYMERLEAAGDDVTKRPVFNMKYQALIPVLKREIPLKAHAHQANDFFTALRIAKEFHVRITLEHVTEGHLAAEELAREQVPLAVGPSFGHATKFELRNKTWKTPAVLSQAGCQVSIITDAPVTPEHYLPLCAGLAVKAGMDPFEALKAITIHPARHIGVDDRVGSLEVGKDADLVITDGSPFEVFTNVKDVFVEGIRL